MNGYNDLQGLWWACFWWLSGSIAFGAFVLDPISKAIRKRNVLHNASSHGEANPRHGNPPSGK